MCIATSMPLGPWALESQEGCQELLTPIRPSDLGLDVSSELPDLL